MHRRARRPNGVSLVAFIAALLPAQHLQAQSGAASLGRQVDSVFAPFSRTSVPGCAVGVDRDGAPLLRRAYGMANLETGTPFTTHTISESGSTAKQFVAASLVMLARDGVLTLDDDVSRWVPEVQGFGRRITVRQLLSHTSGIPDRYTLHAVQDRAAGEVDHPNAEVLDIVARLRDLNFDPGEDYLYSNTAYVVAVAVLERASGRTLQQFSEERIFAPLGMTRTRWREDHRVVVPDRASAYSGSAATGWRNDHPFTRVFGSGGLLLTIDDFLRWSDAMQRGEGAWGAIRDSLSAVIRLNDGTAITYGLGVTTDQWRGVRRVSHTGSTGGYRAALYRFPDQRVSVALLCNSGASNPGALATAVATLTLGDALASVVPPAFPPADIRPESLATLAGRYRSPRTSEVMILQVRNGTLVDSLGGAAYLPTGTGFMQRNGASTLRFAGSGATRTVRVESQGARAVDYVRVGDPAVAPADLAAHAGAYHSPELDATITFVVRSGALAVDGGWRGFAPLRPLFRDGFAMPEGEIVRFTRDARGRITGFTVWAGRVRHLRFEKTTSP